MTQRMSFTDYTKLKAINWSTLKEMRRSPKHYRHRLENPREDSIRLALGRAAHTAVFEPDRFLVEYACYKGGIRRGAKWEAFKEQHQGETILKLEEYQTCLRIRDAVRSHAIAANYLRAGIPESTITWADKVTGLPCKGRPDWISESIPAVVDLKTTGDVSPHRFSAVAARMGYHIQGAFYRDGFMTAAGAMDELMPVVIIAVEVEPPHDVAVYRIDEDALYAGAEEYGELLMKVRECQLKNEWPGNYPDEQDLRLPAWAYGGSDDEDIGIGDIISFGSASANEATAQEE